MKKLLLLFLASGLLLGTTTSAAAKPSKKMKAFTSERELQDYFRRIVAKQKKAYARQQAMSTGETVTVSSSVSHSESVTNTQHAGVDEGGIVKVHGDHLVVLRRGRLFTVAIGDDSLKPVSWIDAFGPDLDPRGAWYDEMLVSGNTIVVIGYSYDRGGTEVGVFNIDAKGQLRYRSTYHLRSNDYYSSRNYASRLIGSKLIFYTPLSFFAWNDEDPFLMFPGVRKWRKGASVKDYRRIVDATRVYRPEFELNVEDGVTLHTVTICDLANGDFDCKATSVMGPPGHVFYVSPDTVYVWAAAWSNEGKSRSSLLFRMPLNGAAPGALRVSGSPVDQFSFLQSDDAHLNVLVHAAAKGDGMWAADVAEGDAALMRIPLSSFSDGSEMVPATSYRQLPKPPGYYFIGRFVGRYLLYGTGSGGGFPDTRPSEKELFVVEWARGDLHKLDLPHGIDRIEPMGTGAVVVGTDLKDLHFTSVRLNPQPQLVARYTQPGADQGESRSHGFFYKPNGEDSGTLGLPISRPGESRYRHLFESSAAILFLRNEGLHFRVVGELGAQPDKVLDDECRASCVDWYGNARPLFLRGRVFALLGYELVEGKLDHDRIAELRRISYAPQLNEPEKR